MTDQEMLQIVNLARKQFQANANLLKYVTYSIITDLPAKLTDYEEKQIIDFFSRDDFICDMTTVDNVWIPGTEGCKSCLIIYLVNPYFLDKEMTESEIIKDITDIIQDKDRYESAQQMFNYLRKTDLALDAANLQGSI